MSARRIRAIEEEAERELASYQPQLDSYLRKFFQRLRREDREDVLQNVWLEYVRFRQAGGVPRSPIAWLTDKTRKRAIDFIRDQSTHPTRGGAGSFGEPPETLLCQSDDGPGTEELALVSLSNRELAALLKRLDSRKQAFLLLRHIYGHSDREVAARLGLTLKAVQHLGARTQLAFAGYLEEAASPAWREAKAQALSKAQRQESRADQLHVLRRLAAAGDEQVRRVMEQLDDTMHAVGLALPAEIVLRAREERGLIEQLAAGLGRARESLTHVAASVLGRGGGIEQASEGGAITGGAGATAGGVALKLSALGIAGKAGIACVGAGAAATACIAAGVTPWSDPAGEDGPRPAREQLTRPVEERPPETLAAPEVQVTPPAGGAEEGGSEADEKPADQQTPSNVEQAPAVEREFGLVEGGTPASSRRSGGDGSSGGGSSGSAASAAAREFGP